jgi:hypothetical protein
MLVPARPQHPIKQNQRFEPGMQYQYAGPHSKLPSVTESPLHREDACCQKEEVHVGREDERCRD